MAKNIWNKITKVNNSNNKNGKQKCSVVVNLLALCPWFWPTASILGISWVSDCRCYWRWGPYLCLCQWSMVFWAASFRIDLSVPKRPTLWMDLSAWSPGGGGHSFIWPVNQSCPHYENPLKPWCLGLHELLTWLGKSTVSEGDVSRSLWTLHTFLCALFVWLWFVPFAIKL